MTALVKVLGGFSKKNLFFITIVFCLILAHLFVGFFLNLQLSKKNLIEVHNMVQSNLYAAKEKFTEFIYEGNSIMNATENELVFSQGSFKKKLELKKFSILLLEEFNKSFIEDIDFLLKKQNEIDYEYITQQSDTTSNELLYNSINKKISVMFSFDFIYYNNNKTLESVFIENPLLKNIKKIDENIYSFQDAELITSQAFQIIDGNIEFTSIDDFGSAIRYYKRTKNWNSGHFSPKITFSAILAGQSDAVSYLSFDKNIAGFDYLYLTRNRTNIKMQTANVMNGYVKFLENNFINAQTNNSSQLRKTILAIKIIKLKETQSKAELIHQAS